MKKVSTNGAQGGFTLIELIVVIVILGILAATALPKFASLSGDARAASLQAAKGAMSATASMLHGKWLIKPEDNKEITVEGVKVSLLNGYPQATKAFAEAAGLNDTDYDIVVAGTGANATVTVRPISVKGNKDLEAGCFVTYMAAAANAAPTYTVKTDKCE